MTHWCGTVGIAILCAACSGPSGTDAGDGGDIDTADGPDADTGDDGGEPVVPEWDEPERSYRVRVTLLPHPDRDRTDLPVLVPLAHAEAYVGRDVRVYEVTAGRSPAAVPAGAWTQPDGREAEVGFTAAGTTAAGAVRDFLVYYEPSVVPPAWEWRTGGFGEFQELDGDGDTRIEAWLLSGGDYRLQRALDPADGSLRRGRRTAGDAFLAHEPGDWQAVEGFSDGYQLEDATHTWDPAGVEDLVPTTTVTDRDPASAAVSAAWTGRTAPVPHDLALAYRVFPAWPFVERVLSAVPQDPATTFFFSSSDWNGRHLYLADDYDRMVSDTRGDEALEKIWDTGMRWLVVYDSASDRGLGWFVFHAGVIRAEDTTDGVTIYDSYGYSAGGAPVFRSLWMADPDKDRIVDLFDALVPGVRVSPPEFRDLNIVAPRADDYLFPGDELSLTVTTPGNPEPATATAMLPDGTELPLELERGTSPLVWRSRTPLPLTDAHPAGSWVLTASSAGLEARVTVQFRHPEHPKLVFDASELAELRARRDRPEWSDVWAEMLDEAEGYDDPIPDPGPGRDIRGYADRLMNLALIQLIDPAQPFDEPLWTYFFTMLRYPNWDEDAAEPFNNLDLTVGHFLTALAITYDWHYDRLTPAERAEVRARLRGVADRWCSTSWMRTYRDIDWTHFGSVTNNHYWINHEGVAAAAFVLADEMPEAERAAWVAQLEENLAIILSVLEDDGTSNEGVAYHSYGQINLFRWLDFRDRALGGNTATAVPWFRESVLWDLYSVLPGGADNYGGVANFGDCPVSHYNSPRTISAWLARRLGDGRAQWTAENLDNPRRTAWSYLWYDPTVAVVERSTLPTWRFFPDKGIWAWRSSWDEDATYLSLKSGSYFGGHEQPDAGHFILHRAGVPYVTDHGYSYLKMSDEHNLLLVDGAGQHGEGTQWMAGQDPTDWAHAEAVLGDARYFDVLADPTSMMLSETLTSWRREVVGLGSDLFFVHDTMQGTAAMTLDLLLHSYRSAAPTGSGLAYTYAELRTENPWREEAAGRWAIHPRDGVPALHVGDASAAAWTATLEPSSYVPEQNPDTRTYNESGARFDVGWRLRRSRTASAATSTTALWFGDDLELESWSDATADAARLHRGGTDSAFVVWPTGAGVTGFHGADVTGAMAGRRLDDPAIFGRGLTAFAAGGDVLVQASAPIDLFARLEHVASATEPRFALVRAAASAVVSLRCPVAPTTVRLDGTDATFAHAGGLLELTVPAGDHRLDLD
ncbi:MAG: heparinase II/III family protein [Deltaproteobacteria bacterium]|nr:heparinase II/III family protein [Deltaproteobacteria bacterium]